MNPTQRFTKRAQDYAAARPSYPDAALDALFAGLGDPRELTVADLGAGTGISSRLLAERGAQVIAVEPNAKMREAAQPHPNVSWCAGTAEATGLDEASIDLVTAFQAFHWFDHADALREMLRILRPAGRAAVIYNERDDGDPFTAAYGDLVRRYALDETEARRAHGLDVFQSFRAWHTQRLSEVPNAQFLDTEGVVARARSSSYLPQTGPLADELHAALRALAATYAVDGLVALRMKTIVVTGDTGTDGA